MPNDSFDAITTPDYTTALESLSKGSTLRDAQNAASHLTARYRHIQADLEALNTSIKGSLPSLKRLVKIVRKGFRPDDSVFDPARDNLSDLSVFKFIDGLGAWLLKHVGDSEIRLGLLDYYLGQLLPVMRGEPNSMNIGSITLAEDAANRIVSTIQDEVQATIIESEKFLATIYLQTRKEYKRLRHKFMGASAGDEHDSLEEDFMMQMFGRKEQAKPIAKPGPDKALIEDNCFLTQLLIDLSDALPKHTTRTMPVIRNGIATGKTRTIQQLDEGDIEEYSSLITAAARPVYLGYVSSPTELLQAVMNVLTGFYVAYTEVGDNLQSLARKAGRAIGGEQRPFANPAAIRRQYLRINFLGIQPDPDDIAPRNKSERDYGVAREKLLGHLKVTVEQLAAMAPVSGADHSEDTEKYAILRTREAIKLKESMDEVMQTEKQRNLQRNIRDDNEFYVGKGGEIGSLKYDREPAPKIAYTDVIGESFIKAKAHVDEVVKIASHPNIMRISAPRGDIKSNLLLIGPYGCGKSFLAQAIAADKRIIGFSVSTADLTTAYMHESPKNIKRLYDAAKEMRKASRDTKPVGILFDEFDGLFSYGEGNHQAYDGRRMETTMQEMMDGIVGYEGVFLVGLTNNPSAIPEAILRRFKYVDVVGQMTVEERANTFEKFLTRGLPIALDVTRDHYLKWAEDLKDAPGDVIGKVADELHFKFMNNFVDNNSKKIASVEGILSKRLKDREIDAKDRTYLIDVLRQYAVITVDEITSGLAATLRQPQVQMQINKAKEVYREAERTLQGLSVVGNRSMGFENQVRSRNKLFEKSA